MAERAAAVTYDVVALTRAAPDVRAVVEAMLRTDPSLRVALLADGAVVQLCDDAGRPMLTIESPLLVQVDGEVSRLLGDEVAARVRAPLWWVEARSPGAVPAAAELARRFATALVGDLGGAVWPPDAAPGSGP